MYHASSNTFSSAAHLSQYDRAGEYHHSSDPRFMSHSRPHSPAGAGSSASGYLRQRTQTPPGDAGGMPGAFGGGGVLRSYAAGAGSNSVVGHGQLVPLKSASPAAASTAMVLASAPPPPTMQLVAVPPQPSPPPPVAAAGPPPQQQPPPIIATAVPGAAATTAAPLVTPTPEVTPTTILIHIPLIPTPFRLSIPPAHSPHVLTDKVNLLLSNPAIQDRIANALSVPKPNSWILVERVSAEYLQLRDLLGAIREGRLMTEGVVPWVCAGELVEGGVGYWCLGVCT